MKKQEIQKNLFNFFAALLCAAASAVSMPVQGAGVFSVSDSTVVELAPSNLQYQPSTGTYRLAEHTLDIIGEANSSFDDSTYGGWLDLLVWGDYTYGDWRMPSLDEWRHLLNYRPNAHLLVGLATAGGQQGSHCCPMRGSSRKVSLSCRARRPVLRSLSAPCCTRT